MSDTRGTPSLLPLELDQVHFQRKGEMLLHPVTLRFERQGRTIVMGPNGAGKSLLMRICHGLLPPSGGQVRWRGALGHDPNARRRRQAMVFQRPVMLRRTALANVTYALAVEGVRWRDRHQQALQALERFGLAQLASRPARVLSGGEQQRLALARAWALQPEILFLDEPTSALDPAAMRAVEDAVGDFHRAGTRIIMSTHDIGQARRLADDVLFLFQGRVLEQTPSDAFFHQPRSREAAAFLRGELIW